MLPSPQMKFRLQYFPVLTPMEAIFCLPSEMEEIYVKRDIYRHISLRMENGLEASINFPGIKFDLIMRVTCFDPLMVNIPWSYTSLRCSGTEGSCDPYIAYKTRWNWQSPKTYGENGEFPDHGILSLRFLQNGSGFLSFLQSKRGIRWQWYLVQPSYRKMALVRS